MHMDHLAYPFEQCSDCACSSHEIAECGGCPVAYAARSGRGVQTDHPDALDESDAEAMYWWVIAVVCVLLAAGAAAVLARWAA